ncbi:hypothetical protein PIB30_087520, partial [Stylosanthes scabra]|nr:hypothetical protein [Stylosanthes scabra]
MHKFQLRQQHEESTEASEQTATSMVVYPLSHVEKEQKPVAEATFITGRSETVSNYDAIELHDSATEQ